MFVLNDGKPHWDKGQTFCLDIFSSFEREASSILLISRIDVRTR